jgi:hypothetical protein
LAPFLINEWTRKSDAGEPEKEEVQVITAINKQNKPDYKLTLEVFPISGIGVRKTVL